MRNTHLILHIPGYAICVFFILYEAESYSSLLLGHGFASHKDAEQYLSTIQITIGEMWLLEIEHVTAVAQLNAL